VFHLILYQPEIPPNTGNIIRLCANVGAQLHLVHPLGFDMNERALRRAGLDYHEFVDVREHVSLNECLSAFDAERVFALTTKGKRSYFDGAFRSGDVFVLGPETRGLPAAVLQEFAADRVLRLPMRPDNRSLNLANSAAVVLYEAWRQSGFDGAAQSASARR
jgi:tRNA (cytidine/uridine-2'-O-)-methyltransferase